MGINNLFGLGTPGFGGAFAQGQGQPGQSYMAAPPPINPQQPMGQSIGQPAQAPNALIDGSGTANQTIAQPNPATPNNPAQPAQPAFQSQLTPQMLSPFYQSSDFNNGLSQSMGMLGFSGLGFGR